MKSGFSINSDSYLWDDFRNGNEKAFVKIYSVFVEVLFQYGMKFTRDSHLVKDCIQELFIEIYSNRQNLGQTNNIKLYLLTSLKHSVLKTLRNQSVFSSINEMEAPFMITYSHHEDIVIEEHAIKKTEAIQKALNELTPRQKEAVYLRFNTGLSYDEICEAMEMNNQSVRNLVFRAVEKMRIVLSQSNIILLYVLKGC